MEDETAFRFDGGATWLNLLATQGQSFGARPVERLRTPEAAHRWLTEVGYPPAQATSSADLDRLVLLREALRELAMAAVARRQPAADALDQVNAAASAVGRGAFTDNPERGVLVESALGMIAIQALVTLHGPDRTLLKQCAEIDCRWVFLDTSGRRHWCPSPSCASRGRVRAHRLRQSAALES